MIRVEWMLWMAGSLGLIYCLAAGCEAIHARRVAAAIEPVVSSETTGLDQNAASDFLWPGAGQSSQPTVVGRVEIPAIGLVTPLMSGDDSMSLSEGAGHIPGTAVPGGLGTVGIAGHRDTHFRLLRKAAPGMDVRLVSRAGVFHYKITSSEIVSPSEVSVLATAQVPGLSLVTCYPFGFIGHAPKRFIVHAALVSVAPDETTTGR